MWPVKEYNVIRERNDARIISWINNIVPDYQQTAITYQEENITE